VTVLETARAIYEEETQDEQSARELASDLRRRAAELRAREIDAKHEEFAEDVRVEVSGVLAAAADDLDSSLGEYNPTMKQLEDGVAGQAKLDSSWMAIDPHVIGGDGAQLIDSTMAKDIARHEAEHQQQSATADAEGIVVGIRIFNAREIREAAAISVQQRQDFLSSEYRHITASLPMDSTDRKLVRGGKFQQLEAKKNGS